MVSELRLVLCCVCSLALLTACEANKVDGDSESTKAHAFFEAAFDEHLKRDPVWQSYLGVKDDYNKWKDLSDQHARETNAITQRQLKELQQSIDYERLDRQNRLSYDLFVDTAKTRLAGFQYRFHDYPVNQMFGWQSRVPAFLINTHQVTSIEDAQAYIARLQAIPTLFEQVIENLEQRATKGIIAPKFVFPYVLNDSRNIIVGKPFQTVADDSALFADIKSKVNALEVTEEKKAQLTEQAEAALAELVLPAYQKLIAYLTELEKRAGTDDGVWRLPDGKAFYAYILKRHTTTELTPNQVHQIGLDEVARIHREMQDIMRQVQFTGDLQQFFQFMREDAQFYYANDKAGKQQYMQDTVAIIDAMRERLDDLFNIKPKAELKVKAVEPFREKSAGIAFYQIPSPDGSRPGIYYANTYDMTRMPNYQMEALAYHEAIPGHHMQLSIAMEMEDLPRFRRYADYTAYIEGWGLYSEKLPKEIGFYQNPYSDFGRLAMELWRAVRLVVDTGIHAKRWTREQAIDYIASNTPDAKEDAVKAAERYIVMPGQATAYKIGMMKILELRAMAIKELGGGFDIRQFHDLILKQGPVPLTILEDIVQEWVRQKKANNSSL